jgi:hypothetical protein
MGDGGGGGGGRKERDERVADIFGRLSRRGGWLTFVRVCVEFGLDLVGTCVCSTPSAESKRVERRLQITCRSKRFIASQRLVSESSVPNRGMRKWIVLKMISSFSANTSENANCPTER